MSLRGTWRPDTPTPDVLQRARVACGWRRIMTVGAWTGRAAGEWWTLHVRRLPSGRWEGRAYRFERD